MARTRGPSRDEITLRAHQLLKEDRERIERLDADIEALDAKLKTQLLDDFRAAFGPETLPMDAGEWEADLPWRRRDSPLPKKLSLTVHVKMSWGRVTYSDVSLTLSGASIGLLKNLRDLNSERSSLVGKTNEPMALYRVAARRDLERKKD